MGLLQGRIKETLVYLSRAVLIRIGERTFGGDRGDAKVVELAAALAAFLTDDTRKAGSGTRCRSCAKRLEVVDIGKCPFRKMV